MQQCIIAKFTGCNLGVGVGGGDVGISGSFHVLSGLIKNHEYKTVLVDVR